MSYEKIYEQYVQFMLDNITTGNIEYDLKNINMFRRYKDASAKMSDDQAHDIYYGIYINFCVNGGQGRVKNLFDDIFDWHRIDYAVKRMKSMNMIGSKLIRGEL